MQMYKAIKLGNLFLRRWTIKERDVTYLVT